MFSLFSMLVTNTVEYSVSFLPFPTSAGKQQASDADATPPTGVQPAAIDLPAKVARVLETKVRVWLDVFGIPLLIVFTYRRK